MIVYFNPNCSKCNEAVDLLNQNSCEFTIRNYLIDPPSVSELKELLSKLGCKAIDITRKSEPLFIEKYANKTLSNDELIKILSENPILIERPIVINNDNAIIGRPPQLVLSLI